MNVKQYWLLWLSNETPDIFFNATAVMQKIADPANTHLHTLIPTEHT